MPPDSSPPIRISPFHHQIADVLEPDAALNQFASMFGGDAVQHARGVKSAHHVTRPVFGFEQPLQQDGIDFVRIHKATVFSSRAKAVSITVSGKAGMAFFFHHNVLKRLNMRLNRLRIDSGETAGSLHCGSAHAARRDCEKISASTLRPDPYMQSMANLKFALAILSRSANLVIAAT